MTLARNFIADLQREQRIGNVSAETERHLTHECGKLGGPNASSNILAAHVKAEIDRLERQATTLRLLCVDLLGVG